MEFRQDGPEDEFDDEGALGAERCELDDELLPLEELLELLDPESMEEEREEEDDEELLLELLVEGDPPPEDPLSLRRCATRETGRQRQAARIQRRARIKPPADITRSEDAKQGPQVKVLLDRRQSK